MFKILLFFSLCLFYQITSSQSKTISIPTTEWMSMQMQSLKIPTAAIGIIQNNKLIHTQVFGKLGDAPAPINTLFQVASLTKPIVEMTVLKLISQGQWKLDEPLYHYWTDPDVATDPNHKLITTRHVIAHQTGFVNWRWLHTTGKLTFDFIPGTKVQYSGEGLEYLKKALENKFKLPLEKIVEKTLFKPAKMKDSHFYWDKHTQKDRFAIAHDKDGTPLPIREYTTASAADLFMSTIDDYTRFGVHVLQMKGLSKDIYNEMQRIQNTVAKTKFGLGWEILDIPTRERVLIHTGSDPGVRTAILLFPQTGRGLVLFTNSDNGMGLLAAVVSNYIDIGNEILKMAN